MVGCFFYFVFGWLVDVLVGDCGYCDEDVGIGDCMYYCVVYLLCGLYVLVVYVLWCVECDWFGD